LIDVAGRRRAVYVAIVAAAVIVSIIPAAASSAYAPPGINRFLYALGQVESGGRYDARNSSSGAYGKYQIMPANWPAWAKTYIGSSTAPQTPANQERVARGKTIDLYRWLDSWPNVAHWWLTGSGERSRSQWSASSKFYIEKVMTIYRATTNEEAIGQKPPPPPPPPPGPVAATNHRIEESNAGIAYAGGWDGARYSGYSNGRVLYSERDGATATYTLYAKSVTWIGPVGSTRGKARVSVDGVSIGVIDLYRSTFRPRVDLFKKSWAHVGTHVIKITVIGSGRPVAIDQFIVTR
jgi:hypothetical protein